jgi:hypothetical protein
MQSTTQNRLEFVIAGILGVLVFAIFTLWGGIPADDRAAQFWLLVVVLFVFLCIFIGVTWHLMFRPLPAGHKNPTATAISASGRRLLALILAMGGLSLVVGPFWDEIWHRQYGIPFGQDFFWRPHLLIYFGFGVGTFLGFWGLIYLVRTYKGTFQQRFRANPLIGLIVLSAAFLMYVVPADPIWHITYGRDLSSWSVPHLLLLISIAILMLLSATVHLSTVAAHEWRGIHRLSFNDVLPLIMFAAIMMPWLQILIIDWDIASVSGDASRIASRYRPEWLMSANIVFTATFVGLVANRSLRTVGAATASGLIALGLRYAMIRIFNIDALMSYNAWILALAPLVAIDLFTAYSVWVRKGQVSWVGAGLAAAVGIVLASPLIPTFYPFLTLSNIALLVLAAVLAGLGGSWLGSLVGEYIGTANKYVEEAERATAASRPLMSLLVFIAFIAFVTFFINTAPPPV